MAQQVVAKLRHYGVDGCFSPGSCDALALDTGCLVDSIHNDWVWNMFMLAPMATSLAPLTTADGDEEWQLALDNAASILEGQSISGYYSGSWVASPRRSRDLPGLAPMLAALSGPHRRPAAPPSPPRPPPARRHRRSRRPRRRRRRCRLRLRCASHLRRRPRLQRPTRARPRGARAEATARRWSAAVRTTRASVRASGIRSACRAPRAAPLAGSASRRRRLRCFRRRPRRRQSRRRRLRLGHCRRHHCPRAARLSVAPASTPPSPPRAPPAARRTHFQPPPRAPPSTPPPAPPPSASPPPDGDSDGNDATIEVVEIVLTATVAGTVDEFDEDAYAANLARELDISADEISLEVTAASVLVVATIRPTDAQAVETIEAAAARSPRRRTCLRFWASTSRRSAPAIVVVLLPRRRRPAPPHTWLRRCRCRRQHLFLFAVAAAGRASSICKRGG